MWGKNSANVTDSSAVSVHGTNPQNLVEKILRAKIYNHAYWKEHCFGLTAESLVDKAMEVEAIGGTYGGIREPTSFIQLTLKMLQIQPEKEIVVEFIKNEDYKYVRALGAYYMRLTGKAVEVYQYLEPLYNDYRKLRRRQVDGSYVLTRMDEFIDELLRADYVLDIALPHLPKRLLLEASGQLRGPRRSALEEELDEEERAQAAAAAEEKERQRLHELHELQRQRPPPPPPPVSNSTATRLPPPPPPPPPPPQPRREREREGDAGRDRDRERVREGERDEGRRRDDERDRREQDRERRDGRGRDDRGRDDRGRDGDPHQGRCLDERGRPADDDMRHHDRRERRDERYATRPPRDFGGPTPRGSSPRRRGRSCSPSGSRSSYSSYSSYSRSPSPPPRR